MNSVGTTKGEELGLRPEGREESDADFRERLRSRDPEALERFFDLYFDRVYRRVHNLVRNTHEAEDLTQSIFLNIHRSLPSYDPKRSLGTWVFTIATNRVHDHWRSRRPRFQWDPEVESTPSPHLGAERPDSELERRERDDEVKRAVYRLPLGMRSVLFLRVYDGLAFDTIAGIMKLTPAAARKRYSRALQFLRSSLTEGVHANI